MLILQNGVKHRGLTYYSKSIQISGRHGRCIALALANVRALRAPLGLTGPDRRHTGLPSHCPLVQGPIAAQPGALGLC